MVKKFGRKEIPLCSSLSSGIRKTTSDWAGILSDTEFGAVSLVPCVELSQIQAYK